jgi:hypothetical protein
MRDVRPYFGFRKASAIDVPNDHDARFRIDQFGRQAHRVRRDGGRPLAIAEDVVAWNIPATTNDIALAPFIDHECSVGKPSEQRFQFHLAAPAGQRGDSRFEINGRHLMQE